MTRELLTFPKKSSSEITLADVSKNDIVPWVASAALTSLIYVGVVLVLSNAMTKEYAFDLAAAALFQQAFLVYGLIGIGCVVACRSLDAWTWALIGLVILFTFMNRDMTLVVYVFPNSIVPAMVAMLGMLSIKRLIEYAYIRRARVLNGSVRMRYSATLAYALLAVSSIVLSIPY